MTDAELNNIVANHIANVCNKLHEQASPFPSEKLADVQDAVYEALQKLGALHRALVDYNDRQNDDLLKQL